MHEHDLEIIAQAVTRILNAEAAKPVDERNAKVIPMVLMTSLSPFVLNLERERDPILRVLIGASLLSVVRDSVTKQLVDAIAR